MYSYGYQFIKGKNIEVKILEVTFEECREVWREIIKFMMDLEKRFREGGEKAEKVIEIFLSEDYGRLTTVSGILFWVLFGKVKVENGQAKIDTKDKLDLKKEENKLLVTSAIKKGKEILEKYKR